MMIRTQNDDIACIIILRFRILFNMMRLTNIIIKSVKRFRAAKLTLTFIQLFQLMDNRRIADTAL